MADSDQIKVIIRLRPLIQREQQNGQDARWSVQDDKKINQKDQTHLAPYVFDQIFDRDCSTWDLYGSLIAPIVEAAMNGYHGTVFAYGQSGSGKTHTMSGSKLEPGIIGLAMQNIFDFIEQKPSHEFLLRSSYMEIYNERIFDLLSNDERHLKLQETPDHQISVSGLTETLVNTCEQVFGVIKTGDSNRRVAETKQNDRSSRSHCIFRIIIESRLRGETDSAVIVAHLNFVDLAGSEKAGENSGDRFKEGCSINKSLFCLSQVISKLSEGAGNQFIPYRDSKLTRILQNALGGNSKTAIVCTINPTTVEESHSTLKFATRAKTIKNKPTVNEVLSDAAMLKKYRNEISRLSKLVKEIGVQDIQMANEDLRKQLEDKQQLIKQLTQQIVVSSTLTDNPNIQKKKLRRETWCAPKLQRRSHFPSLSSVLDQRKITIREESALDLTVMDDLDLDLPRTTISFSLSNESRAKAFLRLSEGNENGEEEEGKAESPTLLQAEEGGMEGSSMDNIDIELMEKMQYEHLLLQEEIQNVKTLLWHAEQQNERLEQRVQHLCDKRFDISLHEWEALMAEKQRLMEEKMQLNDLLSLRVKEVEHLQKALAGQEPYIARLEQQLEAQMGAVNGQLGSSSRRRSNIPVPLKQDENADSPQSLRAPSPLTVQTSDVITSTEDLPQLLYASETVKTRNRTMVDAEMLTEEEWPGVPSVTTTEQSSQSEKVMVDAEIATEVPYPDTDYSNQTSYDNDKKAVCDADVQTEHLTEPSSNSSQNNARETCDADIQTDRFAEDLLNSSPRTRRVIEEMPENMPENDVIERREGKGTSDSFLEGSTELVTQLKEAEQELEQQDQDNRQLKEMLRQAQAEIQRSKEAIAAMEQVDAERLEEISQISKLKSQLSRRDMEIQRLEAKNSHLMDELGHMSLNSSGLSASFSETPRRSVMLAEREAEVWQLKERMVRQAQSLEVLQQENRRLEDLVIELRAQLDEKHHSLMVAKSRASQSFSPPANILTENSRTEEEKEETVEVFEQRAVDKIELESLQRKVYNQESQISRLEAMLQEKDEEFEVLFDKNIMLPKDVAEIRLKEFEELQQHVEQQEEQLQQLEEELAARDAELKKMHASEALQQRSGSHGEESSFQEQLVLEKLMLEEALQEKSQELEDAISKNRDLELKLDERRQIINGLRQEQENLTESLTAAQQQLADTKLTHDVTPDAKYVKSDGEEEKRCEANTSSSTSNQQSVLNKDEEAKIENEMQDTLDESMPAHPVNESQRLDDENNVSVGDVYSLQQEILDKQREQELLELLEEKEKEINSLKEELKRHTTEQLTAHEVLGTEDDVDQDNRSDEEKLDQSVQADILKSDTSNEERDAADDVESGAATEHSLKVLVEEKIVLELRLQELTTISEEKAVLEMKLQELSALAEEKDAMIVRLTNKVQEGGQVEKSQPEATDTEIQSSTASEETVALEARLAGLEAVEEERLALAESLDRLREEKEVAEDNVLQLEAKISELMCASDLGEGLKQIDVIITEKRELEEKVQALLSEVETLKISSRQIQHERDGFQGEVLSVQSQLDQIQGEKELLLAEVRSLRTDLEHMKEAEEELKAELTWQTQTADELQTKLVEVEHEKHRIEAESEEQIAKLTQESEELIQEIEKSNQLLESSEQCRRVMEETIENHKKNIEKLETDNEKLAGERDAFELKEEAAVKQQVKLRQQVEQLENRVVMLEHQLQSSEESKHMLESVLEDRDSAQRVGESLHQKVSQELQESQVLVLDLQARLSKLQPSLQRQEAQVSKLEDIRHQLEKERDDLKEAKVRLEVEKGELQREVLTSLKKVETLAKELQSLRGVAEEKAALQGELKKVNSDTASMKCKVQSLEQQIETGSSRMLQLAAERDQAVCDKKQISTRLQEMEESKHQLTESVQQLQQTYGEVQKRAGDAERECCTLQEKITRQSAEIDGLKKELEHARVNTSNAAPQVTVGETVPVIEFKKMKMVLKNKIRDLHTELKRVKESGSSKDLWIKELTDKLEALEDPENAANKDKEIESLTNSLKRRDLELSYIQSQHQKELAALTKQLSNAQEMITYKESSIAKLKGEIRRIRSEEVSFCTPVQPQPATPTASSSSGSQSQERVISSHSGIIDRYTVTLLEADKYKLQKELKKTQERLKKTEAELHLTKVSLSKAVGRSTSSSTPSQSSTKDSISMGPVTLTSTERSGSDSRSTTPITRLELEPRLSTDTRMSADLRSTSLSQMGSPVDGALGSCGSRPAFSQGDGLSVRFNSASSTGSSVDHKRDRPLLPSLTEKENLPQAADTITSPVNTTSRQGNITGAGADAESPLNIDPEFWKKPLMPPRLKAPYKPLSGRPLSSRTNPNDCKQQ